VASAADKSRIIVVGILIAVTLAAVIAIGSRSPSQTGTIYTNRTFGFSLRLPADYTVTEAPNTNPPQENGTADIIEFAHGSDSVQLTIMYASYASPQLTTQSLLSNFPSVSDMQTQPFPIAPGNTGLALHADPAHPDEISDVWFGENGYLFQLSAFGDGVSALLPIAHSLTLL